MDILIEQLKFEEGLSLKVYRCPAGKHTIGYGHNLDANPYLEGNKIPEVITREVAEVLLQRDVDRTIDQLAAAWSGFGLLTGARRDACINMAFQLGVARFMEFKKLRAALFKCEWAEAYKQAKASQWAKQTPGRAERVASQFLTGEHYAVPVSA
jgi:lysozyme